MTDHRGIPFNYDRTDIDAMLYYILDVDGKRYLAEWSGFGWLPTGIDYDPWQYSFDKHTIHIVAAININTAELVKF